MGKWANDTVLDQLLEAVRDGSVLMLFNTAQPTDRSDALSDALASVSIAPGDFTITDASC
jgi:3-dehydroquinate dehydratase